MFILIASAHAEEFIGGKPNGGSLPTTNNLVLENSFLNFYPWTNGSAYSANNAILYNGISPASSLTITGQYGGAQQNIQGVTGSTQYILSGWFMSGTGNTTNLWLQYYDGTYGNHVMLTLTPTWQYFSVIFTTIPTPTGNSLTIQDNNASGFGTFYVYGVTMRTYP